jgi:hypothetical protein
VDYIHGDRVQVAGERLLDAFFVGLLRTMGDGSESLRARYTIWISAVKGTLKLWGEETNMSGLQ